MIKTITAILILISSVASVSYSIVGMVKPQTTVVYNRANLSPLGIQLLSLFLGVGGLLLLFPQTFKPGGAMLIMHSCITILCFILIRDWKGGTLEFIFLQIPVFILWAGYPISVLEKLKNIVSGTME
jgi:hypothetical protein